MDNSVFKKSKEINELLEKIRNIDNNHFRFFYRKDELKNPYNFFHELEYDLTDAINEVKKLTVKDYLRCLIDSENRFMFMYCFVKKIKEYIVFIKLSLIEKDNKIVYIISFHKAEKDELDKRPYK